MVNGNVILLRGINVGGKNIVPMVGLKSCLEELGFANVSTYIASGNVILESDKPASEIEAQIEAALIKSFKLDSELIKVLALTRTSSRLSSITNLKASATSQKNTTATRSF